MPLPKDDSVLAAAIRSQFKLHGKKATPRVTDDSGKKRIVWPNIPLEIDSDGRPISVSGGASKVTP